VKNSYTQELIDNYENLKDDNVYLYSGLLDTVVHRGVVKALED
jgi:hypothetical protein